MTVLVAAMKNVTSLKLIGGYMKSIVRYYHSRIAIAFAYIQGSYVSTTEEMDFH